MKIKDERRDNHNNLDDEYDDDEDEALGTRWGCGPNQPSFPKSTCLLLIWKKQNTISSWYIMYLPKL